MNQGPRLRIKDVRFFRLVVIGRIVPDPEQKVQGQKFCLRQHIKFRFVGLAEAAGFVLERGAPKKCRISFVDPQRDMLEVQIYDQMDVFVIDGEIGKFAFHVGAQGNVILFGIWHEQSRRVRVSLLRPIFGNNLRKRFFVFCRDDHNGNSGIKTQILG